jgi:hypothetical protein
MLMKNNIENTKYIIAIINETSTAEFVIVFMITGEIIIVLHAEYSLIHRKILMRKVL